jgi:PKHD-type hydroxylase
MFKVIEDILSPGAVQELRAIAASGTFVDGRITNPHNRAKRNEHLTEQDQERYRRSGQIIAAALYANEDFRNYAFPLVIAPPRLTTYRKEMHYGAHADAAFMAIGDPPLRSDLSCTVFLSDPASYDGGELRVDLGAAEVRIKGPAGSAVIYPSTTMHEVTPVTRGERLVGLTFIQSQIPNSDRREWLYELNEVAALEGNGMKPENFTRLQRVQANLLRYFSTIG